MTTNTVDFSVWFYIGSLGGLACCLIAIIASMLYRIVQRRGTLWQLAWSIMCCVVAALLLLPAIIWFYLHVHVHQAPISKLEAWGAMAYISLCGWLIPLGSAIFYFFTAQPRISNTVAPKPMIQKRAPSSFVFSEETPWGWLEYRSGNFQGQRLALKRMVATLGRDEDCDIWVDDENASRFHAELSWQQGHIYLTDYNSLNGTCLNGKRFEGTVLLNSGDLINIGALQFAFILEERSNVIFDQDDPLSRHTWRSTSDLQPETFVDGNSVSSLDVPSVHTSAKVTPPFVKSMSGPVPLRLPSKTKQT